MPKKDVAKNLKLTRQDVYRLMRGARYSLWEANDNYIQLKNASGVPDDKFKLKMLEHRRARADEAEALLEKLARFAVTFPVPNPEDSRTYEIRTPGQPVIRRVGRGPWEEVGTGKKPAQRKTKKGAKS